MKVEKSVLPINIMATITSQLSGFLKACGIASVNKLTALPIEL
jgi:hypothetical protein